MALACGVGARDMGAAAAARGDFFVVRLRAIANLPPGHRRRESVIIASFSFNLVPSP